MRVSGELVARLADSVRFMYDVCIDVLDQESKMENWRSAAVVLEIYKVRQAQWIEGKPEE